MKTQFNSDFFQNNRRRLLEAYEGEGPIVLTANGLLQRNNDNVYPFRQDSSFWYMTGINEADAVLVVDGGSEFIIVPERADIRTAFDGRIEHEAITRISGVNTVYEEPEGWEKLHKLVKKSSVVATLAAADSYIASHGLFTNPARARLISRLKDANLAIEIDDLRSIIAGLRTIKFPEEINAIQTSIDITLEALSQVGENIEQYQYEYELDADITAHFRRSGAVHAYQPIVAAGVNACTLHYIENNQLLKEGSSVLIDAGAEYDMYAADITRTFCSSPNSRQAEVASAVIEVQDYALSLLKPGISVREYEKDIEKFMGEKLLQLNVISEASTENIRKYYPHATSHFLGLDVHDTGDYETPLQVGSVLTVEPGIYIPEEELGIRIEDNVVIEKDGPRVLSHLLPRSLA